jgi:uncharacterized repeat protein (TIGR01451 family)
MAKGILKKISSIAAVCLLVVSTLVFTAPTTVDASYPGGDCDSNAVIRCGINDGNELKRKYRENQGGDTKAIFSHFGMKNESSLNGMVRGRVTKSGDIFVGNKKVASGAVTAGRVKMGSDEKKVPGANAYMRPPSRSFRSNSLETLVKLNDRGEFMYGVIMSCGNPVQAANKVRQPAPKKPAPQPKQPEEKPKEQPERPELEIKKDVRVVGDSEWQQEVTADPDEELQFRITVKNTGETDLENVKIHDSLPSGLRANAGNLDGSTGVDEFEVDELVGDGVNVGRIPGGEMVEIRFAATVDSETGNESNTGSNDSNTNSDSSSDSNDDACDTLRNVAHAEADDVQEEEDDAIVEVCQPEQPEQPEQEQPKPQVKAKQTPPSLPETGVAGVAGIFSISGILGTALYKLKEFYSRFL